MERLIEWFSFCTLSPRKSQSQESTHSMLPLRWNRDPRTWFALIHSWVKCLSVWFLQNHFKVGRDEIQISDLIQFWSWTNSHDENGNPDELLCCIFSCKSLKYGSSKVDSNGCNHIFDISRNDVTLPLLFGELWHHPAPPEMLLSCAIAANYYKSINYRRNNPDNFFFAACLRSFHHIRWETRSNY